ncbi:cytochrome P450 [Gigaspora rosea]|uniref:Cytochrome P450 n=1 Tax=Gigaspora rosea TaxID=44941 RepID=A0A397UQC1_9GLOM|nr:cytochrome P450 [Gigaspora rosea]
MNFLYTILNNIKPTDIFQIIFLTIFFFILHFYYKHFTRPNPLPGPIPIPLIGSFEVLKTNLDVDDYLYKLSKIYGQNGIFELTMIGIRQIIITRAEYAEDFIYPSSSNQDKHTKHIMKTNNEGLLNYFDLENKGIVFNVDYKHWNLIVKFKLINNLFEEMMNCWIKLKKNDEDVTIIDATIWINRLFNDFTSVLLTGKRSFAIEAHYHKFKGNSMTKEMSETENFAECIVHFGSDCQVLYIPKILRHFPIIKGRIEEMKHYCDIAYKMLEEKIKKRRKEIEKIINCSNFDPKKLESDFLTSMIIANTPYETCPQINVDPSLLRPMTDEEIRGVLYDSFLATDTITDALCFIVYYISKHPNVKKKLFEEIKTVFKDDLARQITLDDLNKLKYCEAIIKEVARIRPTFSMVSRLTNKPDEIAGYKWPSDTMFIMFVRGINNNPIYWKDSDQFIPERFYEPQENQHKLAFSMFGGGVRICPGRNLAMIQLKLFLALLYRKVDVELVDMKAPLKLKTSAFTVCENLDIKIIHNQF